MQNFSFNHIYTDRINMFQKAVILLFLSGLVLLGACKKKDAVTKPEPSAVAVSSVTLTPPSVSIAVGATTTLGATVLPNNASNKALTWASSDASIVTVSAEGLVTGIALGSATITITSVDGNKTATAAISVVAKTKDVTGVSVSPTSTTIAIGGNTTLTATVLPSDASNKAVTWTSSDASKATVDANGVVKGVAAGNVTITVTTINGNKTATAAITVAAAAPATPPTADVLKQFTYNNHTYYVIKVAKNWADAAAYAKQYGAYLVEINDQNEQNEMQNQLDGLSFNGLNIVADGGDIQYLWIGATDAKTPDVWYWDGDNDNATANIKFGTGRGVGGATTGVGLWANETGMYSNWGTNVNIKPNTHEPDNYTDANVSPNGQNSGALGLGNWPSGTPSDSAFGTKYQWNDIAGTNTIWFIIEKN